MAIDVFDPQVDAFTDVKMENIGVRTREIINLLKIDGEAFIEFFLGENLDMPVPEFHIEIWDQMTDVEKERVLLAIPRDHAKTTLAKLCVIWYFLFTHHRFCAYLSNTNAIAKGACKDIIGFLKSPNFIEVFGACRWEKESEQESLWIFHIRIGGREKRCILRAIGQGQQMRGINIDNQRPDIAVVDDVEDNDNTESETMQKKLDKWIFGPFIKALARKKKIIWLGNMLSKTSLLARLSKNPKWNPVVYGCLYKDASTGILMPLWPGKWTVEALREDFQEYKLNQLMETWMCEMMNMPGHGENGFDMSQIYYLPMPQPDQMQVTWLTIDPAFGLENINDECCISVHGMATDSSVPVTVAAHHGRWSDTDMFDEALRLALYWNCRTWGIESVAAQKVLISLFRLLCVIRAIPPENFTFLPISSGGKAKGSRIKSWVGLMAKKEWAIHDGDLDITQQLMDYQINVKKQADDIIDSCAYGPLMMDMYLPQILANATETPLDQSKVESGMRVSGDV